MSVDTRQDIKIGMDKTSHFIRKNVSERVKDSEGRFLLIPVNRVFGEGLTVRYG